MTYVLLTLKLALIRLRGRLGLTLLCLLGISLSVGLVLAIPAFSELVSRMVLRQELSDAAAPTQRPLLTLRYYCLPGLKWPLQLEAVEQNGRWLEHITRAEIGLPIVARYTQIESPGFLFRPGKSDEQASGSSSTLFSVAVIEGAEAHVEVLEGDPFSIGDSDEDTLEVWVQAPLRERLGLNVGETHVLSSFGAGPRAEIPIRIAGFWQPRPGSESFWYGDPSKSLAEHFLTTRAAYERHVQPRLAEGTGFDFWYFVLDDDSLRLDEVEHYIEGIERVQRLSAANLPRPGLDLSPIEPLRNARERKQLLSLTLSGLSLPVIGLLLLFLGLISAVAVRSQQGEAAILSSRGASGWHILGISLVEALILALVGAPLSVLAALGLSYLASQAYGFLSFGYRSVSETGLQGLDWRLLLAGLAVTVVVRLLPALGAARKSVVAYERERSRPPLSAPWLRLALLVPLLVATVYAYYELRERGTLGMLSYTAEGSPLRQPLVFLAPLLFFLSGSLLLASLFPLAARLLDLLATIFLPPSGYLGLRGLAREGGQYAGALLLVILCLAIGSFEASIARSADRWFRESLQYEYGADFSFAPIVEDSYEPLLLPVSEYLKVPGVQEATRVLVTPARFDLPGNASLKLDLMGVDRLGFQRVAYWRRDYARVPLGELMNRLAATYDGLIVPDSALSATGLSVGDKVRLDVTVEFDRRPMEFTIVATYDYFPTVFAEQKPPAVVANLDYVVEQAGIILPYGVWVRSAAALDAERLQEGAGSLGVEVYKVRDLRGDLIERSTRLERVGIFGVLSLGFLGAGIVSIVGLLLYIASQLGARLTRFAMLRAIGFSPNQLAVVLTLESVTVVLYGVLAGTVLGIGASRLFVPYFQLTDTPRLPIPPYVPEVAWSETGRLALIFAAVLGSALLGLLLAVARRRLSQTLRLGDQE